jgi:hypothetical protein
MAKCQATKCTNCQIGKPKNTPRAKPLKADCNLSGTDKIHASQGIDQVDPDTPCVLPDEINAHPGDIKAEFIQGQHCFGHLATNQRKLIAQAGILPTRRKQLHAQVCIQPKLQMRSQCKTLPCQWHICGDNLSSRAVSEGGHILSLRSKLKSKLEPRRYGQKVYLQTPRAGKSHAHSPSKLLTQTKIHAS